VTILLRLLAATWLVSAALPTHAQLFADDDARKAILELRGKLAAQERMLQQEGSRLDRLEAAQRNQLELANQTETLRQEIAKLRGQVEALTNEVATLQKRNRDLYSDLDARLKKMEPSSVTVDGRTAAVDRAEQAAYEAALVQFRAGDFRNALVGFQQFLVRYPQSAYASSAQYWIGSSHFALKDYKAAIAAQNVLVERYKDSSRVPDALMSIAESQLQMGDKKGANRTLGQVIKEFPDTEAAQLARGRLPSTR